ncbi:MAG: glycoside hydrolase family 71/99-like protein [Anaerolineales bacterium]
MFGHSEAQNQFRLSKKSPFIYKIFGLFAVLVLAACAAKPATPAPPPTNPPVPATPVPPTITPTETPAPHTTVDASSMEHKLLMGYQGWFTCPGDGSQVNGYFHWFRDNTPSAASLRVDMWPDASELTPGERCPTDMKYPDGQPAYLYSAYNPKTVMRHFAWMSQYGVDGVFVQRFGSELTDPVHFDTRNVVTKNVQAGAEAYGRVFAMMYDTSGMDTNSFVDILEKDWKYTVDVLKVTESPSYLRQNGKPVLAIWGLGFTEHPGTPKQAMELVNFFEKNPDPKYRVTLVGGVPTWWRILQNDALTDPAWADYYCALNVISPWTVGRYRSDVEVDLYKLTMIQDMAAAKKCGAEYMPVVFPGTAFHNDNHANTFNDTPRRGGNFYWRQVYSAVSIGVPMIYNAMFDEVDEDTAMYKIAATKADQPVGVDLVSLDTDGYSLPNDWYLRLAGAATQMLRGEIPLAQNIPIQGAVAPPTPAGVYRIRIQITTSSDWARLNLKSGATLINAQLVSASPQAVNLAANGNQFGIGQPIARANSGATVELVVDVYLSDLQAGAPLEFVIESGAIGHTTIKLFNYLQNTPVEVNTTVLNDTSKTFKVPVEKFTSP